ncbi:hypothetical protein UFOVP1313_66 [uncultured Caudovirales phage]|uniref:Uncharacterized protein n=1 Tax=uncultured Caudovirales phage TaxID=2100421 RepID=A0A6J5RVI0_9CAUD|nr:hypothetical protein UFOVP1313_66 [uncultured Caudovirales phage]
MIAKYAGTCSECGQRFPAGTEIKYDRPTKTARHVDGSACEWAAEYGFDEDRTMVMEDRYDGLSEVEDRWEACA